MTKMIVVTGFRRPEYLRQCLEALVNCRGIENYPVLVSIDGGYGNDPQCAAVAESFQNQLTLEIRQCRNNHGINWHNHTTIERALRVASALDFIVLIEDDCVLAPDALELADWFYAHPRRDEYHCMSLGHGEARYYPLTDPSAIREEPHLWSPWAWCFTRARWEKMKPFWNGKKHVPTGWGYSHGYQMVRNGWKCLMPQLSRAKNIGRDMGTNGTPEWFDANLATQVVSDGSHRGPYEIVSVLPDDWNVFPFEWMKEELAHERES